jgi:hypothetical protein
MIREKNLPRPRGRHWVIRERVLVLVRAPESLRWIEPE